MDFDIIDFSDLVLPTLDSEVEIHLPNTQANDIIVSKEDDKCHVTTESEVIADSENHDTTESNITTNSEIHNKNESSNDLITDVLVESQEQNVRRSTR